RLDPVFVQAVEAAAPLHDIGKVAIPDRVLNKPGPLTADERALMQTHTSVGADTLAEVSARYPFATGFFHIAIEIARHHHERWDGAGYPDRLAGEAIPLSARLVALADVYDALRSRRVYKAAITHAEAVGQMRERSTGHFDPALLDVFGQVSGQFDRIYQETRD
ncbi:MAG TPA: HD domain-containing phosphohydrolase, partial [Fimbriiglobus sp.]|nr:HD domain-containing phosphohydrolase [Fimbriiglobus sp.]